MASRVLLIDDDARLFELLASYLSQNGLHVTGALDGARGLAMLEAGAERVIVGSALVRDEAVDLAFAARLVGAVGLERLVFALDSREGHVSVSGWQQPTEITPLRMMRVLEPWCGAFLYTNVDTEGLMQGLPLEVVRRLRASTRRRLFAAGGITTRSEIETLDGLGVDAIVGMALYSAGSESGLG